MVVVKINSIGKTEIIEFIYWNSKSKSCLNKSIFLDEEKIDYIFNQDVIDLTRYNRTEIKIIKELKNFFENKDCFKSNKTYKFKGIERLSTIKGGFIWKH